MEQGHFRVKQHLPVTTDYFWLVHTIWRLQATDPFSIIIFSIIIFSIIIFSIILLFKSI